MKFNVLTAAMITSGLAFFATSANAAVTTDRHGNVGYDTYDECVTAVKSGNAKFYTPYTYQKPRRWRGETSVKKMTLSEVTIPSNIAADMPLRTSEYSAGACDLGVGRSNGRYGVSGRLVGKYVPFSPDMPVNVYMNRTGQPVRLTMQQCDNHFGGKFPTPVISEAKAPDAQLRIDETRSTEVITMNTKRTIRPAKYEIEKVVIAPEEKIKYIDTRNGTKVVVTDEYNRAIAEGEKVNNEVLEKVVQPTDDSVPVIVVPSP